MSQATIQFDVFKRGEEVTWKKFDPRRDGEILEGAILLMSICGGGSFRVGSLEPATSTGTLPPRHPQILYLIDRQGQFVTFMGVQLRVSGIYLEKVKSPSLGIH